MLACVPRRALEELVATNGAVKDVRLFGPVRSPLRTLPPASEAVANVGTVSQDFRTCRSGSWDAAVRVRRQRNAVLMLEECIDDIEEMPRELCQRPRTTGQLIPKMLLRNLGKEAPRSRQHDINAPCQLRGRQARHGAEIDADEPGDLREGLTVGPLRAARDDRQLARS